MASSSKLEKPTELRIGSPRLKISREATPTTVKQEQAATAIVLDERELTSGLKSDLKSIKSLVTCGICDQLLYTPFTLGCGHTYCYSCLCSWFVPNKRKKTCPECRAAVEAIPVPSFLVQQLVEIFMKQSELMPSDETPLQHAVKRSEEIELVDKDKNTTEGLFKGAFKGGNAAIYDDVDGIVRCPHCLTELTEDTHDICEYCGESVDRDSENDEMMGGYGSEGSIDSVELVGWGEHPLNPIRHGPRNGGYGDRLPPYMMGHDFGPSDYDTDEEEDDEDEDAGSLENFVINDEEPTNPSRRRRAIIISDSESESDVEEIPNRARRHRRAIASPTPSISGISSSELDVDEGELQRAGWGPLNADTDDEDRQDDDESDTETVGNDYNDPRSHDDDSDGGMTARENDDGDTEMSGFSPIRSRTSSIDSEETNNHRAWANFEEERRSESVTSDEQQWNYDNTMQHTSYGWNSNRRSESTTDGPVRSGSRIKRSESTSTSTSVPSSSARSNSENLGVRNIVHDMDEDDSDSEEEPIAPPRRRPRHHLQPTPNYQQMRMPSSVQRRYNFGAEYGHVQNVNYQNTFPHNNSFWSPALSSATHFSNAFQQPQFRPYHPNASGRGHIPFGQPPQYY